MKDTLKKVPRHGADDLFEAIQSFILIWQTMCLEQTPNPFAFSVGNADRIFEPYRAKTNMSREVAASLFKHLHGVLQCGRQKLGNLSESDHRGKIKRRRGSDEPDILCTSGCIL